MPEFKHTAVFLGIEVETSTEAAILVEIEGKEVWIPKSQIDDESEVFNDTEDGRGPGKLVISQWIAEEKGLV